MDTLAVWICPCRHGLESTSVQVKVVFVFERFREFLDPTCKSMLRTIHTSMFSVNMVFQFLCTTFDWSLCSDELAWWSLVNGLPQPQIHELFVYQFGLLVADHWNLHGMAAGTEADTPHSRNSSSGSSVEVQRPGDQGMCGLQRSSNMVTIRQRWWQQRFSKWCCP